MRLEKCYCYRIELETTNAVRNTAEIVGGRYIDVERGVVYFMAGNLEEVAKVFPNILHVERVGTGYVAEVKQ